MKITYDSGAAATYISLSSKLIDKTLQIGDYIMDFAADGTLVGIEYLNAPIIEIDGAEVKLR